MDAMLSVKHLGFAQVDTGFGANGEIAAFLAHVAQETGDGTDFGGGYFVQEVGAPWNWGAYGGVSPQTGAGYFGRGPHQLSWNYNYKAYGQETGVGDLYLNDPELLLLDPVVGIAGSFWFWCHEERTASSPPDVPFKPSAHNVITHQWHPTDRDISVNRVIPYAFAVTTNVINGGIEAGHVDQRAQNRAKYFKLYTPIMGYQLVVELGAPEYLEPINQKNFAEYPSYPAR